MLPGLDIGMVQALGHGIEGRLWVGTRSGLIRLEGEQHTRLSVKDGLSGNLITAIHRDAEGSIWLTSEVPGVDQMRNTKFSAVTLEPSRSQQIATAVFEDSRGALWVGGHQGLSRLDESGSVQWTSQNGLAADLVFSICEGSDNDLWVSTAGGLNRFKDGRWSLFGREEGMPHRVAWCLHTGSRGEIWAGTLRGLARIKGGQVDVFNRQNAGLSHDDVRTVCEDAAGRLWVGTSYGLNVWEDGRFKQFLEGAPGVQFNAVLALHADEAGDVWIGTMEQGLFRWRNGQFARFHTGVGLHDDLILRILEDGLGHLWMSCNRGVFRARKDELNAFADGELAEVRCTVFGKPDGLPSVECNGTFQPAGWKSRDGRLWFPTAKGVAVADPRDLPRNRRPPPVIVEEVRAGGKPVPVSDGMKVGPGARDIAIRFTALTYVAPSQVQFRYRLEGLDEDWLTETAERSARYSHLPPGAYTFRVAAANNDGIWNEAGAALAFQVLPFWWQTPWFTALAALAAGSLTFGAARLWTARRYARKMAEIEHQHAMERERSRIAADLHDDLGSNLGSIALLSASARKQARGEAAEDFGEIQQIAESTAESMRDIVWFINSGEDELPQLILRMKETAARILAETSWEFDAPNLPARKLSAEFKRHFFLIFKESLHNIRKHSRASRVRIEVRAEGGQVELLVADNGTGFSERSAGAGLGLKSMRQRAAALDWGLEIGNGGRGGATVRLSARLPAGKETRV
jgi:signal transduction histidine kinase